ncbi:DUF3891 family protein [Rubrobacter aplysinae]|uniref:DUF3891 family protein n=1 Tax=Rubrobacter aplysinae TaxID=909625 RepID=UPI00064C3C0E|nr:DUF3891 family protein [Rubrobacter aplysinae]
MLVRSREAGYALVEQHEHGLISGELARHWGWAPIPSSSALYAIAEHDLAWKELDAELRWNPETGEPYNFFEYPVQPRLAAYRRGVDAVESQDQYAGLLCSLHYESFVRNATGVVEASFRAAERERQTRLLFAITDEERERVDDELSLLRICDDLSLFLCLNEPGENVYPWFRDGFDYGGTRIMPVWQGGEVLRLDPSPFTEDFGVRIPYRVIDAAGRNLGGGATEVRVSSG